MSFLRDRVPLLIGCATKVIDLIYVVFLTRTDEERGFALLIQRTPVHAYAEGVYGIARSSCGILDEQEVRYRQATKEEISSSICIT